MGKRFFISGVAGFLGSHIATDLLNQGHSVCGIDDLSGGYKSNVPPEVEFLAVDCNNVDAYVHLAKNIDCVFHCAALAYEGLSVFSPHLVNKSIVTATTGVLSTAIKMGTKRFVFCSSMARYGENQVPFTETMAPRPVDPYGIAKYCAELLVANLCSVHGVEYNIAVPHNIIGPRQRYDDPYRNVASIFINKILKNEQPVIYGDGTQKRCFSFIQDSLFGLLKLGMDPDIVNEIFNIGPDEEYITILELAQTIADLLHFKLDPIFIPTGRPQEVKYANCSADKARARLGYRTTYTLRAGLTEMIEFIVRQGPKNFDYNRPLEIITSQTPATWTNRLI